MSCFIKRVLPFVLTLTIGLLIGSLFVSIHTPKHEVGRFEISDGKSCHHRYHGYDNAYDFNAPVSITRKPGAAYTEKARRDGITGVVILRVTFKRDGTVSDIVPVKELHGGLTEEAMKAARRIEFIPARLTDGRPTDATQYVSYYFDGNGPLSEGTFTVYD